MPVALDPVSIGTGALQGAASLAGGILNYDAQKKQQEIDKENLAMQKAQAEQNMEWNKYSQEETWRREDNAVQRRVNDLIQAGLSPTLAAGQAAASSPAVKATQEAPQSGMKALNPAGIARDAGTAAKMFGAGYVQSEEIARSRMEREAIEAQIKKANAETDQIELNNGVFHERVRMQSEQHVKDLLVADFGMDMSRANLLIRQMEQALQQKRYELDRQKYELERSVFRFEQSKWTEQESMRFIQRENERLRGTGLRLDSQRKIIEMEGEAAKAHRSL